MTRRTIEAYEAALRYANTLIELDSQYTAGIIIDFENAMRTALKNVCPNIRVHGCLFHFMQAITRKVPSIPALFELVRNNEDARFLLRKFQSIALLPANKIKDEFASLVRETLGTHKFNQFATFVEYYKNQWINRVKPVHFSEFNLECRTTSPAEAFNGKIVRMGAFSHSLNHCKRRKRLKLTNLVVTLLELCNLIVEKNLIRNVRS